METLEKSLGRDMQEGQMNLDRIRNPIIRRMVDNRYSPNQTDKGSSLWHDYHDTYHETIRSKL